MEVRQESWSYEDICNKTFRYIYPADTFQFDEETGKYTDLTQEELALRTLYNNGEEIRVVGIIRKNSDSISGMLNGSVGYTHALVEHIISMAEQKELVRRQLDEPEIDVFNGLPFLDRENEISVTDRKVNAAKQYIDEATVEQRAEMYVELISTPSDEYLNDMLDEQMEGTTREDIEKMILESYPEYASMLSKMDDNTLDSYLSQMISQQVKEQYAAQMADLYKELSDEELAEDFDLLPLEEDDYIWLYDNYMPPVYSTTTFKDNLKKLGYTDLDSPKTINIYCASFEDKDAIADAIKHYNDSVPDEDEITYTDMVALLMSSITSIINVISYVLIAFVAISLVVSSIMIGIITYISVLERTKEIGILRAIGASKKDVSRVFNAETIIIGFTSGAIGIGMTLLLNLPINWIVHDLTGIYALNSVLPWEGAVGLVAISMFLTYIAGLIPSGIAAKKDPVEALRTE